MIPSSVQYQDTLQQVTHYFVAQGSSLIQAQQQAVAWIGQQVQAQASFLGYMDAFWMLMLISLAAELEAVNGWVTRQPEAWWTESAEDAGSGPPA